MRHTSKQVSVTNATVLKSAQKPSAPLRGNVKPSLTSHENVRKLSVVTSLKGSRQPTMTCRNAVTTKRASCPPVARTADQPLTSSKSADQQQTSYKSVSRSQSVVASSNSSESEVGRLLNRRRSHTSQFIRSVANQRHTSQPPAAVTQCQSAAERRKSYHTQLLAKQKTAVQLSNPHSCRDRGKSTHPPLNDKKIATGEVLHHESCHNRRKSYHAELLVRRKTVVATGKKPAPRRSDIGRIETSVSEAVVQNPRISTPFSSRRTMATTTPSLSCIHKRKTVSFLTPSTSRKTTPHLHRTQPVNKEMSMR